MPNWPGLLKRFSTLKKTCRGVEAKLDDPSFIGKAPPQVVEKEQAKLAEMRSGLCQLKEQAEKIRIFTVK